MRADLEADQKPGRLMMLMESGPGASSQQLLLTSTPPTEH